MGTGGVGGGRGGRGLTTKDLPEDWLADGGFVADSKLSAAKIPGALLWPLIESVTSGDVLLPGVSAARDCRSRATLETVEIPSSAGNRKVPTVSGDLFCWENSRTTRHTAKTNSKILRVFMSGSRV